jgi:hypothetical protein
MGRVIAIIFAVVGLVSATAALYQDNRDTPVVESSAQTASVLEAVETAPTGFSETGTLIFYPNNVGPVPYLFYQDVNGHTVARALVLPYASGVDSSWAGARVFVTGSLDNEHVAISRISYVSGP